MIPIVFSTDHNFIMPTGVAIFSMLECALDAEFDIFILQANDVTDEDRKKLRETVSPYSSRISFISMREYFVGAFEIRNISYATYFRLLIPWLIPQYDKIIYSDGDVIFCDNIQALYEVNLGENYVGGVGINSDKKALNVFKYYVPMIGLDVKEYINGGILLINSKKQREDKLDIRYLEFAKNKYSYQDQDILNIVCKHHIYHVSQRYNCSSSIWYLRDKCVIHYKGNKPWNTFTHLWIRWWEVYRRSPFYDETFEQEVTGKILYSTYSQRQLIALFLRKNAPWILSMKERVLRNKYFEKYFLWTRR